jgi:hypothetical protein
MSAACCIGKKDLCIYSNIKALVFMFLLSTNAHFDFIFKIGEFLHASATDQANLYIKGYMGEFYV